MPVVDRLERVVAHRGWAGVEPKHLIGLGESLPVAIGFFAVRFAYWQQHGVDVLEELAPDSVPPALTWLRDHGANCGFLVLDKHATGTDGISTKYGEACPLSPTSCVGSSDFTHAQQRFHDRLVHDVQLQSKQAALIVAALNEAASNALEHAQTARPPIASFQVCPGRWVWGVTDVGCGLKASLQRNPAFAELRDDVDALQKAVTPGVSSTGIDGRGHGFEDILKALVDRHCELHLRSGKATALWAGRSLTDHTMHNGPAPHRAGLHLLVSRSTGGIRAVISST